MIAQNTRIQFRYNTSKGEKILFGIVQKSGKNGPEVYVHFDGENSECDGWYNVDLLEKIRQ